LGEFIVHSTDWISRAYELHDIADEITEFRKSILETMNQQRSAYAFRYTENIHIMGHVSQEGANFS
jgi:hypothetical protein